MRSGKLKILIIFAVLFLVITALLLFVFFESKTSYTVTFDLDGGTLIKGDLEQKVTKGQDAEPPTVEKDGAYFHSWSKSYKKITKDVVVKAVWEYNTTPGIIYADDEYMNFTEIVSSHPYISGEVFLGAYYNEKQVLTIREHAFENRTGITKVFLLRGILSIGENAFAGCTSLTEITIPKSVTHIEAGAFKNCASLEKLVFEEGLIEIGAGAFENCTSLTEVVIPASVERIAADAFKGCGDLTIKITPAEDKNYGGFETGWDGGANVIWPDGAEMVADLSTPKAMKPQEAA